MVSFARNRWYVVAFGSEVGQRLTQRTVIGEPLVFYRTSAGEITVLADRCVHRRFPLSEGRLEGDTIVCGYHGFTYDAGGRCVSVPGQQRIPRTARVASFPVVERGPLVWVWIGDPAAADPQMIPLIPWLQDPGFATVVGMARLDARWGLLVDNLMDLSHETYLHGDHIGSPEVATTPIVTEVDDDRDVVVVYRRMDDAECPPLYASTTGMSGRIARWQDIEYHAPSLYMLHNRVAPRGVLPPEGGPDTEAFHLEVVHAVTPSTEFSTYDFWLMSRDFAVHDNNVSRLMLRGGQAVVEQDVTALNLLEKVVAAEPSGVQELSVNLDTGGLAARRIIHRMVDAAWSPAAIG